MKIIKESSGRINFEGILCTVNLPSDKSPSGARGHQILLTKDAAQNALSTLLGAPVNYRSDWQGHNVNVTIGMIGKSWIDNEYVKVRGFLLTSKYPHIIDEINNIKESLGMSFEIADAHVENLREVVWKITKISSFTGAAILLKRKAAYYKSSFKLLEF